jgi:hypothetical protein
MGCQMLAQQRTVVRRTLRPGVWVGCLAVLALAAVEGIQCLAQVQTGSIAPATQGPTNEIAALKAEIEQLKGKAPDQAHAMKDVGYHFANLWFAGQKENWPLAKFYLDETRSHLKWAVRIIPVRKTKGGDLELKGILEAVDNSLLAEIQKAIEAKDMARFTNSYRLTVEGCYSCHKAAEKPFLRVQIPAQPEAPGINFDPKATWPE